MIIQCYFLVTRLFRVSTFYPQVFISRKMPRLLKKLKEKLRSTDLQEESNANNLTSVQPDVTSTPNQTVPNHEHAPNSESSAIPKSLQGRLWNAAYEQLKLENSELVESYEKILSRELFRGAHDSSEPTSLENRINAAYDERWRQMQMIVEGAMGRKKETTGKSEKFGSGLSTVRAAMGQAVRAVPEAAVAWTGVCFALEMISNSIQEAKANSEGIVYVVSRMDWYWHLTELLLDDNTSKSAPNSLRAQMEKHISVLYEKLLLFQMKSVCRYYRKHGHVAWRDTIKADDWTGQLDDIRNAEAVVQEDSRIFNALEVRKRLDEIDSTSKVLRIEMQDFWPKIQEHILSKEEERCLKDLRITDPRDDKSRIEDANGGLLQDAYGWAIRHHDFITWRDEMANHLLWIKGDPGKGKTMLLCGIIDELQSQNIKPCYFFCQATDARLNNATAVLRGLIYLLVDTNRQLLSHIQEKYGQAGAALFQDANSWIVLSQIFTKLLDEPSLKGQVFMIDALDECQTDLERLLDLIVGRSASPHAKWIVSSRNWAGIEEKLNNISQKILFSLELNEHSVSEAVRLYIAHKTARLKEAKGLDDETGLIVQHYLASHARGTFLWVALVCKELLKMSVRSRHVVRKMAEFPSELGPLYERMMGQIRESEDADLCERILGLVAVAYRPVTLAELASLLNVEDKLNREDLEETVASCGSFLVVRNGVVRFVHQSAQDFLLKDQMFASGLGHQHYIVFSRSLDILSVTLRRDMYDLRRPGALIEECRSNHSEYVLKHAQYSCIYWADHLEAVCGLEREKCALSLQDDGIVHRFFKDKLLNWLEALSLLKKIPEAIRIVGILQQLIISDERAIRALTEDAYRFILAHKVGVELAPLQVYSSALIFSPTSSIVRQTYEKTEVPKWIISKPEMPIEWTARLQSIEGYEGWIHFLRFSPDGTQLASLSSNDTVKVWDVKTGVCLHTFEYNYDFAHLAFSPHGKYLATCPREPIPEFSVSFREAKVWDLTTSTCLYTFEVDGHVKDFAFSPDSKQLAVSCDRATVIRIRTWDLGTGMESRVHDFSTEDFPSVSTAFSSDGTHFAGAVEVLGKKLQIWNLTTERHLSTSEINDSARIISSVFSPDAAQLAVATTKGMRIFDTLTGAWLHNMEGTRRDFESLQFLVAPTRLLSWDTRNGDLNIRICDPSTGACLQQLSFKAKGPDVRAISPHGTLLALGFRVIEIWDTGLNSSLQTPEKPAIYVYAMAFSLNGTQLAVASSSSPIDGSAIEIRDTTTGACLKRIECAECIESMVFSPDGKQLASGGRTAIEIWSVSSGTCLQTIYLRAGEKIASSMTISSDSSLLATCMEVEGLTEGNIVWICDLITGEILCEILRDVAFGEYATAVGFSPDDAQIAVTLTSGAVLIYDVRMGTHLQTVDNFFEPLDCEPKYFNLQFRTEQFIFAHDGSVAVPPLLKRNEFSPFMICKERTWILRGQQRVLWLPPELRPYVMKVCNGFVACITTRSSDLLYFQFAVGELDKALA
ncbi:hypothetical protein V8C35DRAFT_300153 [Trichoderma chlorosporum]